MQVLKKGYNNQYTPFLIDVAFNICDVLSKRNFMTYATIYRKLLGRFSNVNHSCPYTVNSTRLLQSLHLLYVIVTGSSVRTKLLHRWKLYSNFSSGLLPIRHAYNGELSQQALWNFGLCQVLCAKYGKSENKTRKYYEKTGPIWSFWIMSKFNFKIKIFNPFLIEQ